MASSDQQLLLLEQLTYINDKEKLNEPETLIEKYINVELDFRKGQTVGQILAVFDEEKLRELRNSDKEFGREINGKERPGIIEACQMHRI